MPPGAGADPGTRPPARPGRTRSGRDPRNDAATSGERHVRGRFVRPEGRADQPHDRARPCARPRPPPRTRPRFPRPATARAGRAAADPSGSPRSGRDRRPCLDQLARHASRAPRRPGAARSAGRTRPAARPARRHGPVRRALPASRPTSGARRRPSLAPARARFRAALSRRDGGAARPSASPRRVAAGPRATTRRHPMGEYQWAVEGVPRSDATIPATHRWPTVAQARQSAAEPSR